MLVRSFYKLAQYLKHSLHFYRNFGYNKWSNNNYNFAAFLKKFGWEEKLSKTLMIKKEAYSTVKDNMNNICFVLLL